MEKGTSVGSSGFKRRLFPASLHVAAETNFQKQNWLNTFKGSPLLRRKSLRLIMGSFIHGAQMASVLSFPDALYMLAH